MSKNQHRIAKTVSRDSATIEQSFSYDDSFLPEAEELAKLRELDPNIVEWVKQKTDKEQDKGIKRITKK